MKGEAVIVAAGAGLLRGLFATLRLRLEDQCGITQHSPDFPLIFTFWHNRILAVAVTFLRYYPRQRLGVTVLTSPSRDGAWLAEVVGKLGMKAVRGSSSRRGAVAVRECLHLLQQGADLAITPDGPRGPRYHLGPGVVLLAQQTQARILPIHVRFGAHSALRTWDGFSIPWPFSRLEVTLGPYVSVPATATEEEFAAERQRVEDVLRAPL